VHDGKYRRDLALLEHPHGYRVSSGLVPDPHHVFKAGIQGVRGEVVLGGAQDVFPRAVILAHQLGTVLEGLNPPYHLAQHQVQTLQAIKHQSVDPPNALEKSRIAGKFALPSPVLIFCGCSRLEGGKTRALRGSNVLDVEKITLPVLDGVVAFEFWKVSATARFEAYAPADRQLPALLDGLTLDGVEIFEQFYARFYA